MTDEPLPYEVRKTWRNHLGNQSIDPLRVYEPLAEAGKQTPAQSVDARIYGKALTSWRGRDFAGAAESFASIADHDPAAALFMHRAKQLALSPPGPDWEPINTLEGK